MSKKECIIKILTEFCRVLLGVVFIFSGIVKGIDPMGFVIKIGEYLSAFGLGEFSSFAVIAAFVLIAAEFALGVCLLLAVYRKITTLLVLLFMCVMTPLTFYLALFNPVSDCGCFGDAIVITNWETFSKNIVLLAAAIWVFIYNRRLTPFYSYRVYWGVALFAYLFGIGFCYWNYNHLPMIDFRPYKIGANIPALTSIPEGAPQDEYHYSFIYEKDGVQKEFALEEAPANDSTWHFVESRTELIKQGYVPPVASFDLYTLEGDHVTDQLLEAPALLLLVSPDLDAANDDRIDDINTIYDYLSEKQVPFYCLTGSSEASIRNWIDNTGADYPFLMADATVLKTMIRSNPGLIYLKEGTIMAKWHNNDFPTEEKLGTLIEKYTQMTETPKKDEAPWVAIVLCFVLPLFFIWLYDFVRIRKRKWNTNV